MPVWQSRQAQTTESGLHQVLTLRSNDYV